MYNIQPLIENVIKRTNTLLGTKYVTEELVNSIVMMILNKEKYECLSADIVDGLKNVFQKEEKQKYAFVAFN